MEILSASLRDLGALRTLEHECFGRDAWSILDLIAVLTFADVTRLKALDTDRMVGFVAGDPRPAEGLAWIATICVHPSYQRRGIGRALLRACEEKITLPRMRLTVRLSNSGAIALYQQEGYRTVDVWKSYYSDGEDGMVMEKPLSRRAVFSNAEA
ncbi:MAG TPA: GNAT family N-acetyltransferase [Anaerolineales bacterium]|nr:GNAT family N-acetyltransferase [Anaerolineales bacterium]